MQAVAIDHVHENQRGNREDQQYGALLGKIRDRFTRSIANDAPLFTTDADLWEAYLSAFPEPDRQYHNCSACRHFLQRFGGLVTIDEHGATASAIWDADDADDLHRPAVEAMLRVIRRAKVKSVFLSSEETLGHALTGEWIHFHAVLPKSRLYKRVTLTARQAMAEKREDYKNVSRALGEFTEPLLSQALALLNAEALYRSEKVIGPAKWLHELHGAIKNGNRTNIVWRAVASAPAGFCHPRSSMVGTLLEDLEKGLPFDEVARKFKTKMHPLQYQRPQAAPSAGNIAQGEKVIAALGATGSLSRRFARIDDVQAIWRPQKAAEKPASGGVFSHLKPKGARDPEPLSVGAQTMTWEKFARTVLPNARELRVYVPAHGNFVALLTAEDMSAPPILQWDTEEQRNPVSWYVYHGGSIASQWGLSAGTWTAVTAITSHPSQWFGDKYPHQGKGVCVLIEGAVDSKDDAGNALFPEMLKSEFHGIRATIEAYSRRAKIGGREEASACGIALGDGRGDPLRLRVVDGSGNTFDYTIDRLD